MEAHAILTNPTVERAHPWCRRLSTFELGMLLVLPVEGLAGGLRVAELTERLQLGEDVLGLGPVYFQRVRRAVAGLVEQGLVNSSGAGRSVCYLISPRGFAALVLNLSTLFDDPTIDGSEFELKREIVATWTILAKQLVALGDELAVRLSPFFEEVDDVLIFGRPALDAARLQNLFDVNALIEHQRESVAALLKEAQHLGEAGLSDVEIDEVVLQVSQTIDGDLSDFVRSLGPAYDASLQARVARYESYLGYLDRLSALYEARLGTVDVVEIRERLEAA